MTTNKLNNEYQKLPTESGLYRVDTVSGTVHVIEIPGRISWERRPAAGQMVAAHGNKPVVLTGLGAGWQVGGQGYLEVADETYLTGQTWHRTSSITSITDEAEK